MFGATMGTLEVYVNGTLEWTMSMDQGDQWNIAQIDLSAYAGTDVTFDFVGIAGTSFTSDIAIDQISIDECVSYGCTDSHAPNYDANANVYDGSCAFYCNDVTVSMDMID